MKYIFFILISACSFNIKSAMLTNDLDTGFRIYQTGNTSGAGINGEERLNKDDRFPYWGGYCEKNDKYLCFPNPNKINLAIPQGVNDIELSYYTDNGYGIGAGHVITTSGTYAINFLSYSSTVTRPLRLQVYGDIAMSASDCEGTIPGKTLIPLQSEMTGDLTRVYEINSSRRFSSCSTKFENLEPGKDSRISVSVGAIRFRYDNNIYQKVPSGDHLLEYERMDKIKYTFYDKSGSVISSGMLFDGIKYTFNFAVDAFLDFNLVSPSTMKMFFKPQDKGQHFFHAKTTLRTNLPTVNVVVECQFVEDNRCALSDGSINLPMSMGIRSDHRPANNYSLELKPGVTKNLTQELGIKLLSLSELTFMFGLDSIDVNLRPQAYGKTFSGNINIIIEAGFS
ncbi:hypothetical protein ACEL77_003348 [Salmonella enterica subsp. enterica serovar Saintpaul]|nr:hypothetical protein [Salmonella enterica]EHJ6659810.1 hypothetical protein [Salmonella enterica subsp. enterica serovar Saintpaul]EBO6747525.1 hypothetical protein [Salmonella enterica]EDZ6183810.1 hypothetical protein [Salmonella enterica]EHV6409692.1 hypothetical protein [Salmonella enterica]